MTAALGGGLALTALMTGLVVAVWGRPALAAGLTFGLLATAIQTVSAALMARARDLEFRRLIRRWGVGMGLRLGGVVVLGVLVWLDRERFPPLPAACAYLGVVVPLLFWEIRFLR